jgi:DNA helicase-2/ATP-dependent DNA helicase PcrA
LYVAATRAKKHLFLSYPKELMTPDRQFRRVGVSPFLAELKGGLFERIAEERPTSTPQMGQGLGNGRGESAVPSISHLRKGRSKVAMTDLAKGVRVSHAFFGTGTVAVIHGGRSVDVQFERHGLKTLHLDYAKLTIVTE